MILAGVLASQCVPVKAEESAHTLLDKMWQADKGASFSGRFVYSNGSHVETMHIERHSSNGFLSERLVSSTGGISDVRKDEHFVYRIDPSSKLILLSSSTEVSAEASDKNTAHASLDAYEISIKGFDVVAEHLCQIVVLLPKDSLRYGYGFCIEPGTGVLLSSRAFNQNGETVEQMVFTQVSLDSPGALSPSLQQLERNGYKRQKAKLAVSPIHKKLAWTMLAVPAGFELAEEGERLLPENGEVVRHLLFSDGIASVSVFVQHAPSLSADKKSLSGGLSILSRQQGDYRVVFMGEVPMDTLHLMADGFDVYEEAVQ